MEQPSQQRPRPGSRSFSFKSDKSRNSKTSTKFGKQPLRETAEEKRRSHLSSQTKANPNAAMIEAQPVAAALEAPTLGSLRSVAHIDRFGQPIAEPDLSNPTRPRWERPLDTIRSFEAAIDTEYKRRSVMRTDSTPADFQHGNNSRRSSYYGYDQNPRYSQIGGYYGSRTGAARDSYLDNSYGAPPMQGPSRNRLNQRLQSEPSISRFQNNNAYGNAYGNQQNVYPTQAYQQSRDTVNTGVSSGSEPWANTTDPSSENSSVDRNASVSAKQQAEQLGEQYGLTSFGGAPQIEGYSSPPRKPVAPNTQNSRNMPGAAPAVPSKFPSQPPSNSIHRTKSQGMRISKAAPQPLGVTSGNAPAARPPLVQQTSEKRKSWFKRTFSKA